MSKDLKDADEVLQIAFALLKEEFEERVTSHTLTITETHRAVERQQKLYAQGRTEPGQIVTQIDGIKKKGKHNYFPSRAIDVAVVNKATGKISWDESYYKIFGGMLDEINKKLAPKAVVWGGNWKTFKDLPHFEV